VHNVLVDTGNASDIIFAKAFRQMEEPEDKLQEATNPLCGFRGKHVLALEKKSTPMTSGYVHNTE
jgi:hypothetical protein